MQLTNDQAVRKFIELTEQKRTLKAALKHVQDDLNELEPRILEDFITEGRKNITQTGFTVFLKRERYTKIIGDEADEGTEARQRAILVLKDAGDHFSHLVKEDFNTVSLTAAIKQWLETHKDLPEIFDGVISVSEVFKVQVRKAGNKE